MLPQLDFDRYPSQIFWTVLIVLLLYIFVSSMILPRIIKLIHHRDHKIQTMKQDVVTLENKIMQIDNDIDNLSQEYKDFQNKQNVEFNLYIDTLNKKSNNLIQKQFKNDLEKLHHKIEKENNKFFDDCKKDFDISINKLTKKLNLTDTKS